MPLAPTFPPINSQSPSLGETAPRARVSERTKAAGHENPTLSSERAKRHHGKPTPDAKRPSADHPSPPETAAPMDASHVTPSLIAPSDQPSIDRRDQFSAELDRAAAPATARAPSNATVTTPTTSAGSQHLQPSAQVGIEQLIWHTGPVVPPAVATSSITDSEIDQANATKPAHPQANVAVPLLAAKTSTIHAAPVSAIATDAEMPLTSAPLTPANAAPSPTDSNRPAPPDSQTSANRSEPQFPAVPPMDRSGSAIAENRRIELPPTAPPSSKAAAITAAQLPSDETTATAAPQNATSNAANRSRIEYAAASPMQVNPEVTPAVARAFKVEAQLRFEQLSHASAATSAVASAPVMTAGNDRAMIVPPAADNLAQQLQQHSAAIDDERFAGQVTRGLASMLQQRGGSMTMRLDPPELGELRVQMTMSRGIVSASFTATTPQAHQLLQENLAALRASLEHQGVSVDRLAVHSPQTSNGQQSFREDSAMNSNGRNNHDAAGGESRGRRDEPQQQQQSREYPKSSFSELVEDLRR